MLCSQLPVPLPHLFPVPLLSLPLVVPPSSGHSDSRPMSAPGKRCPPTPRIRPLPWQCPRDWAPSHPTCRDPRVTIPLGPRLLWHLTSFLSFPFTHHSLTKHLFPLTLFFLNFFKIYFHFLEEWKERFVVPLMDAFIRCFFYAP